ncbi:hypothetical protein NliqN6_3202 [Naganishia liquefaciens]|uniref:Uncharacterized protein n=1 Tax=Naganishia liquefaciens TaxID=104408 RepID=A0A8H3YEP5_9TREE|nr:hypothetical protein NliqN6_3202 [Naganishia liquefaciens]
MERNEGSVSAEAESHAVNLKVMRLSRPGLAISTSPFSQKTSEQPNNVGDAFRTGLRDKDKRNSTSLRNLFPESSEQDVTLPLDDIPLSAVLLLPEAVGSICLGETFRSIITLSNDSAIPIGEPRIVVEMQTNTRKVEVTRKEPVPKAAGGKGVLYNDDHIETIVNWEMQELGMTVLSVTVSYEASVGRREFVRYYKFNVTAPLAIKTKTHLPSAVNALFRPDIRERIYLEVVIQNINHTPVSFTSINFIPVPGVSVVEAPASDIQQEKESSQKSVRLTLFNGPAEMLQPGNTRQLLYVLAPAARPAFPKSSLFLPHHAPGQMLPLGKLDLAWSGPYGEPGHLVTSVLARRAPSIPPTMTLQLPVSDLQNPDRPALDVDVTILGWERQVRLWERAVMKLRLAIRSTVPLGEEDRTIHVGCQWLVVNKVKPSPPAEAPIIHTAPLEPAPSRSLLSQARLPHLLPNRFSRPATPASAPSTPALPSPLALSRQTSIASAAKGPSGIAEASDFPPGPYLDIVDDGREPQSYDGFIDFTDHSLQLTKIELQDLEASPVIRDETPRTSIDGNQVLPPPPPPKAKALPEGFVDFNLFLMPERVGLGQIQGLRILQIFNPDDVDFGGGRVLAEFPTLGEVWIDCNPALSRQLETESLA